MIYSKNNNKLIDPNGLAIRISSNKITLLAVAYEE